MLMNLSAAEHVEMARELIVLRKDTTWKCGPAQKRIIRAVREFLRSRPAARGAPLELVLERSGLAPEAFFDALRRLARRGTVDVVTA